MGLRGLLTAILGGSQGLSTTRMNMPYLLGTMFTPNRELAKLIGILFHLVNGWLFSLLYIAAFHAGGMATWWLERCWDEVGILADALEDGGCEVQGILEHLRGPGSHSHGCHVIDALSDRG